MIFKTIMDTIKRYSRYNLIKIWRTNSKMRKMNLHINDLFIFWDLDNTIYLFSEWGKDKEQIKESEKEGFYTKLPIFPGASAFLQFLMTLCPNVYILSKYPRTGADLEKIAAIERDMPFFPKEHIILIGLDEDKGQIIRSICNPSKAIIIDDYHANIIEAYNQGIVGIKKTYSGKRRPVYQISEFYELLLVLKKLNINLNITGTMKKVK